MALRALLPSFIVTIVGVGEKITINLDFLYIWQYLRRYNGFVKLKIDRRISRGALSLSLKFRGITEG